MGIPQHALDIALRLGIVLPLSPNTWRQASIMPRCLAWFRPVRVQLQCDDRMHPHGGHILHTIWAPLMWLSPIAYALRKRTGRSSCAAQAMREMQPSMRLHGAQNTNPCELCLAHPGGKSHAWPRLLAALEPTGHVCAELPVTPRHCWQAIGATGSSLGRPGRHSGPPDPNHMNKVPDVLAPRAMTARTGHPRQL